MSKVTLFFKPIFDVYYNISLMKKNKDALKISKKDSISRTMSKVRLMFF